jgi:inorganic pyrophosphatase
VQDLSGYLGTIHTICVDRPLGCTHDGQVYTVNYGYIPGTVSADDEPVDVYILGVFEPVETIECLLFALVKREDDVEQKLVGVPTDIGYLYTMDQVAALIQFRERKHVSRVMGLSNFANESGQWCTVGDQLVSYDGGKGGNV